MKNKNLDIIKKRYLILFCSETVPVIVFLYASSTWTFQGASLASLIVFQAIQILATMFVTNILLFVIDSRRKKPMPLLLTLGLSFLLIPTLWFALSVLFGVFLAFWLNFTGESFVS
ncbi:hypothetical protein COY16_05180 [Candidatus Roizmanbacteria bacterium CG_4_10_14_0_2_um_filter_39_13]|uniref:Uncharacterized protein n=1 Tax=Candidatus Roizmanbacteria bacterium CG_4_10_14_0_2_um_filter_39_13 TaxID=1974825 RepID=A0A2M7TWI7_9BACT|nr:MAG: hypothetical protein COY16_05180 [Candidatus Roizmanbacteria bacterium CG_4_10_14_0_2_um_filter_39_13]